jgi:CO dehydrogenase maturation factor
MGKVIAIAGKGGVGKTTIAGLVIKYLRDKYKGSILAVDGDPSTNLNVVLGMDVHQTIGSIREAGLPGSKNKENNNDGYMEKPVSMSLYDFVDYQINMALVEGDNNIDLIAMGRPEGKGCYCAVNNALRECLQKLSQDYAWLVIDNEAGLEHISRQTNINVDIMLIISDMSVRGLTTAIRINKLIKELENDVDKCFLIINRSNIQYQEELPDTWQRRLKEAGLCIAGSLPVDTQIERYDIEGKPIIELPESSPLYQMLQQIMNDIIGDGV